MWEQEKFASLPLLLPEVLMNRLICAAHPWNGSYLIQEREVFHELEQPK
jgi:hypothetical protein